jgi:hypothetical protein
MNKNIKIFNSYTNRFNTILGSFPVYIPTGEVECGVKEEFTNTIKDIEELLKENSNVATTTQSPDDTLLLVDAELNSIIDTFYLEN